MRTLLPMMLTLALAPMVQADPGLDLRLQGAIELPKAAQALRDAGIDASEVKLILRTAKKDKVPANETREVLDESTKSVKEKGPIDNFGAFVQSKLDEGLRGKELADAIHAEHEARGKGNGNGHDKHEDKDHDKDQGVDEGNGKSKDRASSGDHGTPEDRASSGDHGKSGDHGRAHEGGSRKPTDGGKGNSDKSSSGQKQGGSPQGKK